MERVTGGLGIAYIYVLHPQAELNGHDTGSGHGLEPLPPPTSGHRGTTESAGRKLYLHRQSVCTNSCMHHFPDHGEVQGCSLMQK